MKKTKETTITHEQFQEALKIVEDYKAQLERQLTDVKELVKFSDVSKYSGDTLLAETTCSTKLLNIFKNLEPYLHEELPMLAANDKQLPVDAEKLRLKDLQGLSEKRFLRWRKAGIGSLMELKELCLHAGVRLSL